MEKLPNKIRLERDYTGQNPYVKAFSTKALSGFWSTTPNNCGFEWFVLDTTNSNPPGSWSIWCCPTRKAARDLVWYHKSANLATLDTPAKYYFHPKKNTVNFT